MSGVIRISTFKNSDEGIRPQLQVETLRVIITQFRKKWRDHADKMKSHRFPKVEYITQPVEGLAVS